MLGLLKKKPQKTEPAPDTPAATPVEQKSETGEAAAPADAAAPAQKPVPAKKKKPKKRGLGAIVFAIDPPGDKPLKNPELEYKRYLRVWARVRIQGYLLCFLIVLTAMGTRIFANTHEYYARRIGAPIGNEKRLIELNIPVMTKESILAWSTSTVTEILTFNFANYNQRISMFAERFTPDGWAAFAKALYQTGTIEKFKAQQLVATAAPSELPTMESEGENPETLEYEWHVKVPVIRKFLTNNDRSETRKTEIFLTIIRMPLVDYPSGLAIKVWREQ